MLLYYNEIIQKFLTFDVKTNMIQFPAVSCFHLPIYPSIYTSQVQTTILLNGIFWSWNFCKETEEQLWALTVSIKSFQSEEDQKIALPRLTSGGH